MRPLVLPVLGTIMLVVSACSGNDEPATDVRARAPAQPTAPPETSSAGIAQGNRIDWDSALAGLTADAREDALDLVADAREKRLQVAQWLGEAIEKEEQAREYQAAGDDERARRASEQAAEQRRRAKEKALEARADNARALALAAGDGNDAGERAGSKVVHGAGQFGVEKFKVVYTMEGQRNGTRTLYVEEHGARVGMQEDLVTYGQHTQTLYYWNGEQSYLQDSPDAAVVSNRWRSKASEPTAFATTGAQQLEVTGYRRIGDKIVAGQSCEHWKHEQLNFEGCRYNGIELEFLNGAGTAQIIQSARALEFVKGEGIPARLKGLAR